MRPNIITLIYETCGGMDRLSKYVQVILFLFSLLSDYSKCDARKRLYIYMIYSSMLLLSCIIRCFSNNEIIDRFTCIIFSHSWRYVRVRIVAANGLQKVVSRTSLPACSILLWRSIRAASLLVYLLDWKLRSYAHTIQHFGFNIALFLCQYSI